MFIENKRVRALRTIYAATLALSFVSIASLANGQTIRELPAPTVQLPDNEAGSPLIGRIRHAALLKDGGIVIADDAESAMRWYDQAGKHIRSVGREGGGPGEFRAVEWVGQCGDSVIAFDRLESRVSVFTSSGRFVRHEAALGIVGALGCMNDGTLVGIAPAGGGSQQLVRGNIMLVQNESVRPVVRNVLLSDQRPLGATLRISADGQLIAFGAGDSAHVNTLDLKTKKVSHISAGRFGRAPSSAQVDEAIEVLATAIHGTEAEYEMMRGFIRRIPPAKQLPAFSGLFLDASSREIWVVVSAAGNQETVLERRSASGSLLELVRIPQDMSVMDVHNGRLLGRVMDRESGEEYLVLYKLGR